MALIYNISILTTALNKCPNIILDFCQEFYQQPISAEFIWSQVSIPLILYQYLIKPPLKVWFQFQPEICLDYIAKYLYDESSPIRLIQQHTPSYDYISNNDLKSILYKDQILNCQSIKINSRIHPVEFSKLPVAKTVINIPVQKLQLASWTELYLPPLIRLIRKKSVNLAEFSSLKLKDLKQIIEFHQITNINNVNRKIELQYTLVSRANFTVIQTANQLYDNILKHNKYWKIFNIVSQPQWKHRQLKFSSDPKHDSEYILRYLSRPDLWLIEPEILLLVEDHNLQLNGYNMLQQKPDHIIYKLFKYQIAILNNYYGGYQDNSENNENLACLTLYTNLLHHDQWKVNFSSPDIMVEDYDQQLLYLVYHNLSTLGLYPKKLIRTVNLAVNLHYWFHYASKNNENSINEENNKSIWINKIIDKEDNNYDWSSIRQRYNLTQRELYELALLYNQISLPHRLLDNIMSNKRKTLIILGRIFNLPFWLTKLMSRKDLIGYLTIPNYDYAFNNYLLEGQRANIYNYLPNKELRSLAKLYNLNSDMSNSDIISSVLSYKKHPLENWLLDRKMYNIQSMMDKLGMSICPENLSFDLIIDLEFLPLLDSSNKTSDETFCIEKSLLDDYFCSRLVQYYNKWKYCQTFLPPIPTLAQLKTIPQDNILQCLDLYSDKAISNLSNAFILYSDRQELLQEFLSLLLWPGFFVPCLVSKSVLDKRPSDMCWNDFCDLKFFLAYGTLDNYCLISVEELSSSFAQTTLGENGSASNANNNLETVIGFNFGFPHIPDSDLDLSTVRSLQKLLYRYKELLSDDPYIDRLLNKIKIGLNYYSDIDESSDKILKRYKLLSADDKTVICQWLEQLFMAGMYMRRWTGPPMSYPLSKASTSRLDIDPNKLTIPILEKMDVMIKEMNSRPRDILSEMEIVEFKKSKQIWEKVSVTVLAKELYHGNRCIRQYSTFCLGTSYLWFMLFTKSNIGGQDFHPRQAAKILHEPEAEL